MYCIFFLVAESSWDESSNLKMRTSADHHHHQPPSPAAEKKMIITRDSTTDPDGKKSANNNNYISWRKFKTIVGDYQKKAKSPPPSPGSPSGGNQSPRTSSPPAHSLCNIRIKWTVRSRSEYYYCWVGLY